MKFNKLMMATLSVIAILSQGSYGYAASTTNKDTDLENITPGFSQEEIQKSNDRVTSFTNTFTGSQIVKDDQKKTTQKTDTNVKSEFSGSASTATNMIVSTQQSTGYPGDFWGRTSDGKWILIQQGSPAIGWKMVWGKWYYMNYDGIMQTGWLNYNGKWYYLKSNGEMAVNTFIDGYRIAGNGIMV